MHIARLDEIYASQARRETITKTIELMKRVNRNKQQTTANERKGSRE